MFGSVVESCRDELEFKNYLIIYLSLINKIILDKEVLELCNSCLQQEGIEWHNSCKLALWRKFEKKIQGHGKFNFFSGRVLKFIFRLFGKEVRSLILPKIKELDRGKNGKFTCYDANVLEAVQEIFYGHDKVEFIKDIAKKYHSDFEALIQIKEKCRIDDTKRYWMAVLYQQSSLARYQLLSRLDQQDFLCGLQVLYEFTFSWENICNYDQSVGLLKSAKSKSIGQEYALRQYGLSLPEENIVHRWLNCKDDPSFGLFLLRYFENYSIYDFEKWKMGFDFIEIKEKSKEKSAVHVTLLLQCLAVIKQEITNGDKPIKKEGFGLFNVAHQFFQFLVPRIDSSHLLNLIENRNEPKLQKCPSWNLFAGYWFMDVVSSLRNTSDGTWSCKYSKKYVKFFLKHVKEVNHFIKQDYKNAWYHLYDRFGLEFDSCRISAVGDGDDWNEILDYDQSVSGFKGEGSSLRALIETKKPKPQENNEKTV